MRTRELSRCRLEQCVLAASVHRSARATGLPADSLPLHRRKLCDKIAVSAVALREQKQREKAQAVRSNGKWSSPMQLLQGIILLQGCN